MGDQDAEDIRRQMARIRRELDEDVESVVEQARELADWRNFVKRHPLLTVAGAVAIGFLVVPNRLNVMSPDSRTLEKLAKRNRLVVKPKAEVRRQSGIVAPLFTFVATALLRSGVAMAGERLGAMISPTNKNSGASTTTSQVEQS